MWRLHAQMQTVICSIIRWTQRLKQRRTDLVESWKNWVNVYPMTAKIVRHILAAWKDDHIQLNLPNFKTHGIEDGMLALLKQWLFIGEFWCGLVDHRQVDITSDLMIHSQFWLASMEWSTSCIRDDEALLQIILLFIWYLWFSGVSICWDGFKRVL